MTNDRERRPDIDWLAWAAKQAGVQLKPDGS